MNYVIHSNYFSARTTVQVLFCDVSQRSYFMFWLIVEFSWLCFAKKITNGFALSAEPDATVTRVFRVIVGHEAFLCACGVIWPDGILYSCVTIVKEMP